MIFDRDLRNEKKLMSINLFFILKRRFYRIVRRVSAFVHEHVIRKTVVFTQRGLQVLFLVDCFVALTLSSWSVTLWSADLLVTHSGLVPDRSLQRLDDLVTVATEDGSDRIKYGIVILIWLQHWWKASGVVNWLGSWENLRKRHLVLAVLWLSDGVLSDLKIALIPQRVRNSLPIFSRSSEAEVDGVAGGRQPRHWVEAHCGGGGRDGGVTRGPVPVTRPWSKQRQEDRK